MQTKLLYAPASYAMGAGLTCYGYAVHVKGPFAEADVFVDEGFVGRVDPSTPEFDKKVRVKVFEAVNLKRGRGSWTDEIRDHDTEAYGREMWPGHTYRPRRPDTPYGSLKVFEWSEKVCEGDFFEFPKPK